MPVLARLFGSAARAAGRWVATLAEAVTAQIDDHLDGGRLPLQLVAGANVASMLVLACLWS